MHVIRGDPVKWSTKRRSSSENISEKYVYSIVKITRSYDHLTWPTHLFEKFTRCAKPSEVLIVQYHKHMEIMPWAFVQITIFLGNQLMVYCITAIDPNPD